MLLIGTDCPAQTVADLEAAVAALRDADAVIQPAEDGGYVLIGMNDARPALFTDIAWGSATVSSRRRARAPTNTASGSPNCRPAGISIAAKTSTARSRSGSST